MIEIKIKLRADSIKKLWEAIHYIYKDESPVNLIFGIDSTSFISINEKITRGANFNEAIENFRREAILYVEYDGKEVIK